LQTKPQSCCIDQTSLGKAAILRSIFDTDGSIRFSNAMTPQILAVLEGLPVLVSAMDLHERSITYWNRECESVSGYTSDELVEQSEALQWLYPESLYLTRKLADFLESGPSFRDI
jgi:PAS domain-containing protein